MRYTRSARRAPDPARMLLHCAVLVLLPACQPSGPDAPKETYLGKLGLNLSVATPAIKPTRLPQHPMAGNLQLDIPSSNLDTLDFLAVSGCAVQATIVKRNSSLGRSAKPSQRLLLELEYLQLAPRCITQLRDSNGALAELLEESWQLKQAQLPKMIFNATLGSDEYRALWLAAPVPGDYPRVSHSVAVDALDAINLHARRWLSGDYRAQNREFEVLLSEVAGGDGGTLFQALSDQGECVPTADCIDPHLRELMLPLAALEEQLTTALPRPYRNWMDDRNQRVAMPTSAPTDIGSNSNISSGPARRTEQRRAQKSGNWLH